MNEVLLNKPHQKIGRILRVFRERTGRNQADVAAQAGISTSMLSQIERGAVAPSIDTLVDVCTAMDLDMAELFNWVGSQKKVRINRPAQRLRRNKNGTSYELLVASQDRSFPAELFLIEVPPSQTVGLGGLGHEGVEMGYVLQGTARLIVDNVDYALQAGDAVTFSAHLQHSIHNQGSAIFRAVWSVLPPHTDYLEIAESESSSPTSS